MQGLWVLPPARPAGEFTDNATFQAMALCLLFLAVHEPEILTFMGFRDSLLRGKIDGLQRNIAISEKLSSNAERLESLNRQLADAETELKRITDCN
jgi:hypothetical protein